MSAEAPRNIKLKAAGLLTAVALPLLLAGCVDKSASPTPTKPPEITNPLPTSEAGALQEVRKHQHPDLPFAINVPVKWFSFDGPNFSTFSPIMDKGQEVKPGTPVFGVIRYPERPPNVKSPREVAESYKSFGAENANDIEKVSTPVQTEVDGYQAWKIDINAIPDASHNVDSKRTLFFFTDKEGAMWNITYLGSASTYNENLPTFKEMLFSFHITENK